MPKDREMLLAARINLLSAELGPLPLDPEHQPQPELTIIDVSDFDKNQAECDDGVSQNVYCPDDEKAG